MGGFTLELSQAKLGVTLGSALCRSRRDRGGFLVSNRTKRRLPRGFDRPFVTHWYTLEKSHPALTVVLVIGM